MSDQLENRWQSIDRKDAMTPEFYDLVKILVEENLNEFAKLKADDSAELDMTPSAQLDMTPSAVSAPAPSEAKGSANMQGSALDMLSSRDRPGVEFVRIYAEGMNPVKVKEMVRTRLKNHDLPDGTLIEAEGRTTKWERN